MKTNKLWVAALAMMMAAATSVGFVSCSDDDEPTPEIVVNPLDAEAYYIIGQVTDGSVALGDVAVSTSGVSTTTAADGTYKLQLKNKGVYAVTFAKEGYVGVTASAEIASSLKTQSSVSLDLELSALNKSMVVNPEQEQLIIEERREITSMLFPVGAVDQETAVTITEYLDALGSADIASLTTINCLPDGLKFNVPVEFRVKNLTSPDVQFIDVQHFVKKSGSDWMTAEENFVYNAEKNAYVTLLNSFSDHSARVKCSMKKEKAPSEVGSSVTISNKGNMSSKQQEVAYLCKSGWEVIDIQGAEKASAADQTALKGAIEGLVASQMGTRAGVNTQTVNLGMANIDGDCDVTYTAEILSEIRTITVPVLILDERHDVAMTFKVYVGANIHKEVEYGEHHTDHSGGAVGR